MKLDTKTYRTRAEEPKIGKAEEQRDATSWRIRTGGLWLAKQKEGLILVADFDKGCVAAVREEEWEGSHPQRRITNLDLGIEDVEDEEQGERLKRIRAASVFRATLSNGRVAIPREIVWLLQRDNEEARDVTLVSIPPVVEIWPTRRWEEYLAGHLFRGAKETWGNERKNALPLR